MSQDHLKNIYEALGSLVFRYHGKKMFVSKNEESGEYELKAVYN